MKSRGVVFVFALAVLLAAPAFAQSRMAGSYIESRTADVYTGPCFANAEIGLAGHEAILGWNVDQGSWGGVTLDGLSVVAVVRARTTIGDPYVKLDSPHTVFLVDERANDAQRAALVNFAQTQTAGLLDDVLAIQAVPIRFSLSHERHGVATLEAGNVVRLETRAITENDDICHNEEVFYPPLASGLTHAMPAYSARAMYRGNHLDYTWNETGRRGSFVGTFAD